LEPFVYKDGVFTTLYLVSTFPNVGHSDILSIPVDYGKSIYFIENVVILQPTFPLEWLD